jgi:predicted DNA-binding transcriptional regulator YafY
LSRAERLPQLLQILRRHRVPVTASVLAADAGVSLRTLYRDVAALRAQGACIEGEAGVGYVLRPGFVLPPLMFSAEEIEALVLGFRWVAGRADPALAAAARDALAKVEAVLLLVAELNRTRRNKLDNSRCSGPPRESGVDHLCWPGCGAARRAAQLPMVRRST